jgi:DNA-binding response OmpR family regulator
MVSTQVARDRTGSPFARSFESGPPGNDQASASSNAFVPIVMIMADPGDVHGPLRELALRIEKLLGQGSSSVGAVSPAVLQLAELRVDRGTYQVTVAGAPVRLTGLEFRLIAALLERQGTVLTRAELLQDVWHISAKNQTRTVDTHVRRLRIKLGVAGRLIETVRGVGYRASEVRP